MSEFSGGMHDGSGFESGMMDGSGADAGAFGAGGPSTTAAWNPGIKGVKFSDMLQGINVTPNFMLAMLFLGFTAWLFVIYWIRHNEPLANKVLGSPEAGAPLALQDRQIVNATKNALPIRTNARMGNFYTPDKEARRKHEEEMERQRQADAAFRANIAMPHTAPHGMNQLHFAAPGASHARVLKDNREHVVVPHPEPMVMAPEMQSHQYRQLPSAVPTVNPAMQANPYAYANGSYYNSAGAGSHYHVPVHTADGKRLKTVVSR